MVWQKAKLWDAWCRAEFSNDSAVDSGGRTTFVVRDCLSHGGIFSLPDLCSVSLPFTSQLLPLPKAVHEFPSTFWGCSTSVHLVPLMEKVEHLFASLESLCCTFHSVGTPFTLFCPPVLPEGGWWGCSPIIKGPMLCVLFQEHA